MEDLADLACVAERRDVDRRLLDQVKKELVADGSYRIEFVRSASKDLRAIDRQMLPRIIRAIEELASDPHRWDAGSL